MSLRIGSVMYSLLATGLISHSFFKGREVKEQKQEDKERYLALAEEKRKRKNLKRLNIKNK